jgi:serine/threonine protein kinase
MTVIDETRSTGTELVVPSPARWLGGRFRLDERITAAGGLSVWKATDDLLCRPVTVHLLPRGAPVPSHVVEAVQAAARVNDPRLATIYDTDFSAESPYIVSEWTRGTHLEDLVLSGLPRPALAAAMIADAADALAVAHQAGRPHLCLGPRSARWDTSSGLKITGLGIDKALSETALSETALSETALSGTAGAADPAAADTMALARMLYALLTGYWPGDEATALPAAPRHRGRLYSPRQVRAGVPGVLDAITRYALQLQPSVPRSLRTPAGLAMALQSVQHPSYASSRAAGPLRSAPARHARPRNGVRHRTELLRPAA